jgi:Protein of unknown function (DUF4240)
MHAGRLSKHTLAGASLAAVGLALATGCGGMADSQQGTVTVTVSAAAPAAAAPATTGTTAVEPVASLTELSTTQGAPAAAPPDNSATSAAPVALDEAQFWQLIEETRRDAGNDTGRQSELLKNRLTQLSPAAIVEFARIRHRLDQEAYTWDLWAAATVIEDGCSDDCFRDFRGYIISLGQGPFENALRDPDSLASVAQDAETGDWENADNVAPDAYSSRTSDDFPLDDSDLSGPPRGTPFNENDRAGLARRYPRLAARFR